MSGPRATRKTDAAVEFVKRIMEPPFGVPVVNESLSTTNSPVGRSHVTPLKSQECRGTLNCVELVLKFDTESDETTDRLTGWLARIHSVALDFFFASNWGLGTNFAFVTADSTELSDRPTYFPGDSHHDGNTSSRDDGRGV